MITPSSSSSKTNHQSENPKSNLPDASRNQTDIVTPWNQVAISIRIIRVIFPPIPTIFVQSEIHP
jgi:hypothetical protein